MPVRSHAFKRLVLGLQPGASGRAMKAAVEFADLLGLDLLGLFLEDPHLKELAGMPFLREFKLLGGGWRPIDLDRLSRDFELAARNAERIFAEAARELSTKWQFEVVRGLTRENFASVSRSGDIIMIVQPANPAEHATRQFAWLAEAAFRSASAVMLAPPQAVRPAGPIIAIAASPHDPAIRTAATIATAVGEELVIVQAYTGVADDGVRKLSEQPGLKISKVAAGLNLLLDPSSLSSLLGQLKGRLLVLTRGATAIDALVLAGLFRHMAVLAIEPADTLPNAAPQTKPAAL